MVRSGRFAWIGGGRHLTDTTHVDNVVRGLRLAADRGRSGEAYFVTDGEPVVFREFVSDLLRTQGVEPPTRTIPIPVAGVLAAGGELGLAPAAARREPAAEPLRVLGLLAGVHDRHLQGPRRARLCAVAHARRGARGPTRGARVGTGPRAWGCTLNPDGPGNHRQGPAARRGAQVQGLRAPRGVDQPVRARARAARRRRDPPARRRAARARPRGRERSTICSPRRSRSAARRQADARPAPLRRAADRRHGARLRRDRGDEDGRGQDADGDARGLPEHARRRARAPRDRQRLPRPPRRTVDEADLRPARRLGRRDPVGDAARRAARDVRARRHLRHQLRVRLRLPARQHGELARGMRPARVRLRDRRRGRQHPHGRGADALDHLGAPRAGGGHLLHLRPAGEADGGRGDEAEAEVARRVSRHLRGDARLRVRREAQDGRPDRGRRREGRAVPRRRQPLRLRARDPRQPPDPVAEGRVAVQARHRLRGDRRRGEDHRRVHRPHPRGPPLVGRPAPGGRGEGGRADPRGEPDPRHDHPPELLPPLREALRDDRHRAHRGAGVHEDLRDAGGRGPDQRADGPRRPQRPHLQDQGGKWKAVVERDQGAPRDGQPSSSARSRSRSRRCSPTS